MLTVADIERFLDNTQPPDRFRELGILQFAKSCFPSEFTNEFALLHYDIQKIFLSLYHPKRIARQDKQAYGLIHRDGSKTTSGSFLFSLFQIYCKGYTAFVRYDAEGWEGADVHNYEILPIPVGEDFILICSETGSTAEEFVSNIRVQIDERTDLIQVFGDKQPSMLQVDEEEGVRRRKGDTTWRKNCFITADKTIVRGVGCGMQVRGKNIRNKRPTLAIVDDMYSENNTKTAEAREKQNRWFWAQMGGSVDTAKGKMIWLGTMVHEETVITKIRKMDSWYGIERPLIGMEELQRMLTHCSVVDDQLQIPSYEECCELQKTCTTLSWPDRHTLYSVLQKYKEAFEIERLRYFYMEYLNSTDSPETAKFNDSHFTFTPVTLGYHEGNLCISFEYRGLIWRGPAKFNGGIDIASSEKKASDDTALSLTMLCHARAEIPGTDQVLEKIFPVIYWIEGGKYDIIEPEDKSKKGIANQAEYWCRQVPVRSITVEINGQQGLVAREVRRHLTKEKLYVPVIEEFNTGNKEERILSTLLPLAQKYGTFIINKAAPQGAKFVSQLKTLGNDSHDDYPDSVAASFKEAQVEKPLPTAIERYQRKRLQKKKGPAQFGARAWEVM